MSAPTTKEAPNLVSAKIVIIDDGKGNLQHCKPNKTINHLILHRDDGPAIEYANGYKAHFVNGIKHGPVEFGGRICSIWKNGVRT